MLIGYNTNGFAHHSLDDAIDILAELGYSAIAITPDIHHLPPFSVSSGELRSVRRRLESAGLAPVIETGARYVLDARRKHTPTLLDQDSGARQKRLDFLNRCAAIASEIGAGVVSIWSGKKPECVSDSNADAFLASGVRSLCEESATLGVRVGFEPEPGMWIETLGQWDKLHGAVGHPALGLTLDVGHVPCTEPISPGEAIASHLDRLVNVHLDDVCGGIHEHLQLGEGEIDWQATLRALEHFDGVASVELSRHSHDAPAAAGAALAFLKSHTRG